MSPAVRRQKELSVPKIVTPHANLRRIHKAAAHHSYPKQSLPLAGMGLLLDSKFRCSHSQKFQERCGVCTEDACVIEIAAERGKIRRSVRLKDLHYNANISKRSQLKWGKKWIIRSSLRFRECQTPETPTPFYWVNHHVS